MELDFLQGFRSLFNPGPELRLASEFVFRIRVSPQRYRQSSRMKCPFRGWTAWERVSSANCSLSFQDAEAP